MAQQYPDRVNEQSPAPMDISPGGHESVSMFGKVKNKAKKMRDKVKAQYDHHSGGKKEDGGKEEDDEEEEFDEDEDQGHEKPDENVEGLTKGMAGLGGLGAANKDDRSNQESENVNKSKFGDTLGINDGKSTDKTDHKDGVFTEAKESPKEDLSYVKETEQDRTEKGEDRTDVGSGTPSIPQKAGVAMAGATAGVLGLGKENKQEGGLEEKPKPNTSVFHEPPPGLKEVPKLLVEEFQSLIGKPKDQQDGVGERNKLSSDEKQTGENKFGSPEVTKKTPGLIQGLRDSLTSDQGKKDAILPEEQSRENQDEGMQSKGEDRGGYAQKLFAAKNVISSKLGYGGQPNDQQSGVGEENELSSNEKPTGEVKSGPSGLVQGLKNSLTSDESKKDDIVPEEQNRENQDEGEDKGGQGYAQKLFAAKNVISQKIGYGGEEKAAVEGSNGEDKLQGPKTDELGAENEDKGGQGYAQKLFAAKNVISYKMGYGGQPNEEKPPVEESKGEEKLQVPKTEEVTENKETFKSTIVSKLSPGEDDKALSEKITEAFNNSAKSILGGFYGGSPKAEVPPSVPPSANEGAAESPKNSNPQTASTPKGIVGRVTGVVSSFIGKKPKEDVDNSSPQAQDLTHGELKEEPTGSSETTQTGNRIEEATK